MENSLSEAIKSAKYNEAVVATISGKNTTSKEVVLVAALDKLNGGIVWQDVSQKSSGSDERDVGILRHLRTKRWVMPMLNDKKRNTLYESAIKLACQHEIKKAEDNQSNNTIIRILDIGSGTGLLAMIAAKYLSSQGLNVEIVSVEMASAMARLAKRTIESNGLENSINVIEGHSCDASFLPYETAKANMCTSELLESGLLGEGILPAIRDAFERHLNGHATVVPQRARIYAKVMEGEHSIASYRGPKVDLGLSENVRLSTNLDDRNVLLGNEGGFLVPLHADGLNKRCDSNGYFIGRSIIDDNSLEDAKALTESKLVLDFDFSAKDALPPPEGRSIVTTISPIASGTAHGILFWWELDLWEGMTYSTALEKGNDWQDHWMQCLFVFGEDSDDCPLIVEGKPFNLISTHTDTSISFRIENIESDNVVRPSKKRQRVNDKNEVVLNQSLKRHITPQRALQLNDTTRMRIIASAIGTSIKIRGRGASILDVSDFSLCAMIAATLFDAEQVTSLESSSGGIPLLSATVAQVGNNLPQESCHFQIVNAHPEHLAVEHVCGGKADIVLAEPYYELLEGWHIQEALNYFYLIKSLKRKQVIKSDAISVPSFASIKACAIELDPDVFEAYSEFPRKEVCGFRHEDVANHGALHDTYDTLFPLWQYRWKPLSEPFEVAKMSYEGGEAKMHVSNCESWVSSNFTCPGSCHAVAFFIEYGMRVTDENSVESFSMISTGNRYHQQALRFLNQPEIIGGNECSHCRVCVKMDFGNDDQDYDLELKVDRRK